MVARFVAGRDCGRVQHRQYNVGGGFRRHSAAAASVGRNFCQFELYLDARLFYDCSLEKGDRVVTSSGIFGMIDTVKDNSFILKLNDNVKVEFAKYAVTQVLEKKNPPQPEPKKSIFSGFGKKKSEKDKTDKPKTEL